MGLSIKENSKAVLGFIKQTATLLSYPFGYLAIIPGALAGLVIGIASCKFPELKKHITGTANIGFDFVHSIVTQAFYYGLCGSLFAFIGAATGFYLLGFAVFFASEMLANIIMGRVRRVIQSFKEEPALYTYPEMICLIMNRPFEKMTLSESSLLTINAVTLVGFAAITALAVFGTIIAAPFRRKAVFHEVRGILNQATEIIKLLSNTLLLAEPILAEPKPIQAGSIIKTAEIERFPGKSRTLSKFNSEDPTNTSSANSPARHRPSL